MKLKTEEKEKINIANVAKDYENENISIKNIMQKYNIVSYSKLYSILGKYYGSKDLIPLRRFPKKNEKVSKSLNSHQKEVKRKLNVINLDIDNKEKENDVKFVFAGKEINDDKLFYFKNNKDNFITAGLINNRHKLPDHINTFIFESISSENIHNYEYMDDVVLGFINSKMKDKDTLILYCTGFQPALISVINVCQKYKKNVICKHHNNETNTYYTQKVISDTTKEIINPFKEVNRDIYLYDTTLDKLIKSQTAYCLSLNTHNDKNDTRYLDLKYVMFDNIDTAFKKYVEFIKNIQDSTELNSVYLSYIDINENGFTWGNNISKGFNFK